jgi:hypothetical protein
MIEALRRYIEAEDYPTSRYRVGRTPVFVDSHRARCAVAALLEASGHGELVQRIARDHNLAYVRELAGHPDIASDIERWLGAHGLTLAEAERIQPAYDHTVYVDWQPTVGIVASAQVGGATNAGAELAIAPGARIGARRVTHSHGPMSGTPVYQSMAWVAEYSRTFVIGVGQTNTVAVGIGYALREGWFPFFGEILLSGLGGETEGFVLRGGAAVGVTW